ncbi:MAG TPA: YXWGXW repeat-containing protein [Bryobacteraceae bacterium]|nr:YXWGXW repeat-containing protein [Bryobacteraceae bacterium]
MKKLLMVAALAAGTMFGQVSLGISIGAPPPPRVLRVHPRQPGPDFIWVDGYWYAEGGRWVWHQGYWTRPPYAGATWIAPRYEGGRFFAGYWNTPHGRIEHDHRWDHERARDFDRDRDHHDDHR